MNMSNNDRLTRLRYALDIKDSDMLRIFALGGVEVSMDDYKQMLKRMNEDRYELDLSDEDFERFMNGMITSQRGPKEGPEPELELNQDNANNLFIKKLKIALSLTTEEMIDIWDDAGVIVTKGELGAFLRKEGHRNYKPCGDNFTRNFLKGLMPRYRK